MAEIDPAYLRQPIDRFYVGETVRIALPLGSLDPASVAALIFRMDQEGVHDPLQVTASLTDAVPAGQSGVQRIDASEVNPQPVPPLMPGSLVYEAIVETAGLPGGWWTWSATIDWPFGRRVVAAGRLNLRMPPIG